MICFVRTMPMLLLLVGCAPRDVIPSGSDHPASPEAPAGAGPAQGEDGGPPPAQDAPAAIAAAEKAALERAMPVLRRHCAGCHMPGGPKATTAKLAHFSMGTYPFGGEHAGEMGATIRRVLGLAGEKAVMPADRPGAVQGEELELVGAWTEAFDRAHAAGLHRPPTPDSHEDGHGHHGHH